MSAAHTPGPWHVNFKKFSQINAENGALIATANNLNGLANLQANTHLIAAAPELLKALKGVVRVADRATVEFDAAHDAIAKAEGATS